MLDVGNHCAYNTRTSRFLPLPGVLAEGKDVAGEVAFARTTTLWRRATPFNEAGSARSPPTRLLLATTSEDVLHAEDIGTWSRVID